LLLFGAESCVLQFAIKKLKIKIYITVMYITHNIMHVPRFGENRGVYVVLVGKPERNRLLGRHRRRWEDNNMFLQEVGSGAWTGSIWLRIGTGGGHL